MSLANKIRLGKCPDECGRDIYSLGEYRGFKLTLKPFFTKDWVVIAEKMFTDALDMVLLVKHSDYMRSDTGQISVGSQAEALQTVKSAIDDFHKSKEEVLRSTSAKKVGFTEDGRYRLIRNSIETDEYFTVEADETFEFVKVK